MKSRRKILQLFLAFFLAISFVFFIPRISRGESPDEQLENKKKEIEEIESKISELQGKQQTIATTISYLTNKIKLTEAQISQTEHEIGILEGEIEKLSTKIGQLDISLTDVSQLLATRIETTYKRARLKPIFLLFSSSDFSAFFSKIKYLKAAQMHDREIMMEMEESRANFDAQKQLKEEKQKQLEDLKVKLGGQKQSLAIQKQDQQNILGLTKKEETDYQAKLSTLLAELEAIQAIIAGKGEETKVGDIKTGDKIATIINSASVCSTGRHLHFEIVKGGAHHDPAGYLKSKSIEYGENVGHMNFTGSWEWPMNDPIEITQEYGETYWTRTGYLWYKFHTGVDMDSSNSSVKAVRDGTLYRGSVACGGGTLRYVKVDHKDSEVDTYYLHVNY